MVLGIRQGNATILCWNVLLMPVLLTEEQLQQQNFSRRYLFYHFCMFYFTDCPA